PSWTAARTAASAGLDAEGKRALANLGAMTVATLRADLAGLVEELASDLDALAAAQFANVVRATLAQAVARFNQDSLAGTAAVGETAATCARIEQDLLAAEQDLWKA